jgi:hypothetical protein
MMELVVNKCYGGFGLSKKAVVRLAEMHGKKAFLFAKDGLHGEYKPITADSDDNRNWSAFTIQNPNEYFKKEKEWQEMTMEERIAENGKYDAVSLDSRPDDRADPFLVQVVKELGKGANGFCAQLEIVEIPDGIEWHLDEYDGIESVHENHRSW